jgi:nucleotide-binding universal stress UspA family protein
MLPIMRSAAAFATPLGALAVRASTEPLDTAGIRRLLLATDLSPASHAATEEGLAIARGVGAQLIVLSVVDPAYLRLPGGRFLRRIDQERSRVEAGVQQIVARARTAGVSATFLVWEGDPSETILEAADAEDVDLIVMGSHGRGRLGRLFLGSTSSRVSSESTRRVIVVQS